MTPSSPNGPCRTGNTTASGGSPSRGGRAPRSGSWRSRSSGEGRRSTAATSARTRSASTHRLSWVSPINLTAQSTLERRLHDATRRDARHLVLGRGPPVDDRQHSGIRHRPRLYNRPRGRCVRFSISELAARLGGEQVGPGRHRHGSEHRHQDAGARTALRPDRRRTRRARLHPRRPRSQGPPPTSRHGNRSAGRRSSSGTPASRS